MTERFKLFHIFHSVRLEPATFQDLLRPSIHAFLFQTTNEKVQRRMNNFWFVKTFLIETLQLQFRLNESKSTLIEWLITCGLNEKNRLLLTTTSNNKLDLWFILLMQSKKSSQLNPIQSNTAVILFAGTEWCLIINELWQIIFLCSLIVCGSEWKCEII